MYNFANSKYFKLSEFDSRDVPGSGKNMQAEFMRKLEGARRIAGISFVINSGFRTRQRNKAVGGAADSTHLSGWAADISAKTDLEFETILNACMLAGFQRFGLMETAIHVDCHPLRPVSVWVYDQKSVEQNKRLDFFKGVWGFYETARKNKLII